MGEVSINEGEMNKKEKRNTTHQQLDSPIGEKENPETMNGFSLEFGRTRFSVFSFAIEKSGQCLQSSRVCSEFAEKEVDRTDYMVLRLMFDSGGYERT